MNLNVAIKIAFNKQKDTFLESLLFHKGGGGGGEGRCLKCEVIMRLVKRSYLGIFQFYSRC